MTPQDSKKHGLLPLRLHRIPFYMSNSIDSEKLPGFLSLNSRWELHEMTISDWTTFRKAYLAAQELFLRTYEDVIGVGYELLDIDGDQKKSKPVIVILVRKELPTDRTSYKQHVEKEFQGFLLISREPRKSHVDLSTIDWVKVNRVAEILSHLDGSSR